MWISEPTGRDFTAFLFSANIRVSMDDRDLGNDSYERL